MHVEIKMPQLGESVTEGTIGQWLVKPGDRVKKYQPIAEVVTDKVNAEIPAPEDGTLRSLEVAEGQTVAVGVLIATMSIEGMVEVAGTAFPEAAMAQSVDVRAGGVMAARVDQADRAAAVAVVERPPGDGVTTMQGRYSPAVLKLAQVHGVDLARVQGTGLGGRITRKDVEAHIATRRQGEAPTPAPQASAAVPAEQAAGTAAAPVLPRPAAPAAADPGDQRLPVGPVRRRIAEKMVRAKHEQPHAWTMIRADVTGLARLRNQEKDGFRAREGVDLTYLPFFIRAVCAALREYPMVNSTWAGEEIILHREVNISIAVATENALAVPVIRNADRLSIAGLAHAVSQLAERARQGRLTLDDVQGGTFTVNNTGAFGSVLSAPIINHPQAAILTMEAIVREPVVTADDAIAIRHVVNLCCSMDHRVLDGLVVGRFLQAVRSQLEAWGPGVSIS